LIHETHLKEGTALRGVVLPIWVNHLTGEPGKHQNISAIRAAQIMIAVIGTKTQKTSCGINYSSGGFI
jgi:hypothetical protein